MLALALAEGAETLVERDGVSVVVRGQSTWTSRPSGRTNKTAAVASSAFLVFNASSGVSCPFLFLIFSHATGGTQVFGLEESQDCVLHSSFHATIPLSTDPGLR